MQGGGNIIVEFARRAAALARFEWAARVAARRPAAGEEVPRRPPPRKQVLLRDLEHLHPAPAVARVVQDPRGGRVRLGRRREADARAALGEGFLFRRNFAEISEISHFSVRSEIFFVSVKFFG